MLNYSLAADAGLAAGGEGLATAGARGELESSAEDV